MITGMTRRYICLLVAFVMVFEVLLSASPAYATSVGETRTVSTTISNSVMGAPTKTVTVITTLMAYKAAQKAKTGVQSSVGDFSVFMSAAAFICAVQDLITSFFTGPNGIIIKTKLVYTKYENRKEGYIKYAWKPVSWTWSKY